MATHLKALATLIHISDLHIGRMTAADQERLDRFPPWFKGKAGDDPRAETALLEFFECNSIADGAWLIFSGDLTAFGEEDQFERGEGLLREIAEAGKRQRTEAIAGNHDYWPGCYAAIPPRQPWFLQRRNKRPDRIFVNRSCVRDLDGIGQGFSVRLIVLNSDSEVWGDDKTDGLRRLFAQGACVQDAERALAALAENPGCPKTLTVLLMHHSPHYRWKEHFMLHEIEPSTVAISAIFSTNTGFRSSSPGTFMTTPYLSISAKEANMKGCRVLRPAAARRPSGARGAVIVRGVWTSVSTASILASLRCSDWTRRKARARLCRTNWASARECSPHTSYPIQSDVGSGVLEGGGVLGN